MTELYTKIIFNLVLRNIRKLDTYKSVSELLKFDSLPADLQQSWWLLCEFAFEALEKDQLVFSEEDAELDLEVFVSKGLARFGLLQAAESECGDKSFHFLHLTFQEYLAALHLTRQPTDKQHEIFQSHLKYRSVMFLKFFFGLNDFSSDTAIVSDILQMLEDKVPDILSDTPLTFCHCAFEAQNNLINDKIIQFIISSLRHTCNTIRFGNPRTAHDCAAILYVLENIQKCDHRDIALDVGDCGFKDSQIKKLVDILANKKGMLLIEELNLHGAKLTVSGLQTLIKMIHADLLPSLKYFDLGEALTFDAASNVKWVTTFVEALSAHCPILDMLLFSDTVLGIPGMSAMLKIRDHHPNCSLELNNTDLGDEGLAVLSKNIKGEVPELRLEYNDILTHGVTCLADAICSGKFNITDRLHLSGNPLGLEGAIAVGRMLSGSHPTFTLSAIELCDCNLTTAGGSLPNINSDISSCKAVGQQLCQIPQCRTIKNIDLSNNSFTGEGIHVLAGFLHLCPHLTTLFTQVCGITSDDLIWLLGKLKSSSHHLCSELRGWFLAYNEIDDRGVSALLDHHVQSLLPHLCAQVHNNPGVSSEMKIRLDEELRRHKQVSYSV